MAALLGNHVLTESDLSTFHARLIPKLENKVSILNRLLTSLQASQENIQHFKTRNF
jgi:hypothetical protein